MATPVVADPPPRQRSWQALFWGLAAFLFLPQLPFLNLFAPVAQTALLIVPIVAVCALAGWLAGGKAWLAVAWLALAAWALATPLTTVGSSYERMVRGWALVLAGSFGLVTVWNTSSGFISRAIGALGIAVAVAFLLAIFSPAGPDRFQRVANTELTRRASELTNYYRSNEAKDWQRRFALPANADSLLIEDVTHAAAQSERIVPALLALESLAAMALVWTLYHRISRQAVGPQLSPLRDFRFNDQLIWGIAVGVTLLLPAFQAARTVGINLLLFFGVLYVLRGLGVMTSFSRRRHVLLFVVAASIVLSPLIWPFTLALFFAAAALGFTDTWLNWRGRRPAA